MDLYKSNTNNNVQFENTDPELDTLYLLDIGNRTLEDNLQSLVGYLSSRSMDLLPDMSNKGQIQKDLYRNIKGSLHGIIQNLSQTTHIIPAEHEILMSFNGFHDLYKSIPKFVANKFQDVETIKIHYHLCSQIYDGQFMYSDCYTKLYDLEFNDIVEFPNGHRWYCVDDGSGIILQSFSSLIAVLEANKKFTQCLRRMYEFMGDAFIILIDEIIISKTNGTNDVYISIEDFITDYLSVGNYRYKYDWYWRLNTNER